ncbi:hypothetical protein [Paenibacillus pabuli]|uniref:hypothetical protein n=1 Tax=Paenibacillus pabuli TaxID=1472 RepID=UPI003CEC6F99
MKSEEGQNQRNDASLIAFTDHPAERPFIVDLQTELNEVRLQQKLLSFFIGHPS